MNITELNKIEAMRYMGVKDKTDKVALRLLNECENELLRVAKPRYVYKIFDIDRTIKESEGVGFCGADFFLMGNSIVQHLKGCEKAALIAVTLSDSVDRLIRTAGLKDMAKACAYDCLASVMTEQVCDEVERQIAGEYPLLYLTFRFGLGYGDLPLSHQKQFLNVLDASKRIGLNVTDMNLMIPTKSVTCVVGLSSSPISSERKGCISCSLKGSCAYRKEGLRCNV